MSQTLRVYQLWSPRGEHSPNINALHPRNRGIDWLAVANYVETGAPKDVLDYDVYVKEPKGAPIHALWLSGVPVPALSEELRGILDAAIGAATDYGALRVNGREFWFPRVPVSNGALNKEASQLRYRPNGNFVAIEYPVWNRDVVSGLGMFRIDLSAGSWATTPFFEAFQASGMAGIHFQELGDVV